MVQALVSIFVENSLGASRKDSSTATTFINEQIKSYEAKLEGGRPAQSSGSRTCLGNRMSDAAAHLSELSSQLERARLEYRRP